MPLKRSLVKLAIDGRGKFRRDPLCIRPLVNPLDDSEEGNSSIDLRLGRWFLSLRETNQPELDFLERAGRLDVDLARKRFVRFDDKFVLHPGRFVLGTTLEWVGMSNRLAGSIVGKSSLGRHGLIIETAPVVHPGFSGCLTLELANVGEIPIALRPGMEIAQLQLEYANGPGQGTGRFSGYRRPVLGPLKEDQMLMILGGRKRRPENHTTI
jgi:dCTP deaminase